MGTLSTVEEIIEQASKNVEEQEGTNKEISFNRAKKLVRKAEAYEDGILLEHEITETTLDAVKDLRARRAKNERERDNAHRHLQRVLLPSRRVALHGRKVFIETNVPDYAGAQTACRAQGMRLQTDRSDADIFVLADPSKPGQRSSWALVVGGGLAVTLEFIKSCGANGGSIAYSAASAAKRHLWISPAFLRAHQELAMIVTQIAQRPNAKWTLVYGESVYLDLVCKHTNRPAKQQRHYEAIALVTPALKAERRFSKVKGAFIKSAFIDFFQKVDVCASTVWGLQALRRSSHALQACDAGCAAGVMTAKTTLTVAPSCM